MALCVHLAPPLQVVVHSGHDASDWLADSTGVESVTLGEVFISKLGVCD